MTDEQDLLDRWTEWLRGDLWQQVHEIFIQVHVFRSWNEIVEAGIEESKKPGFFHSWVSHNYLDSIASGVRRLSDLDDRTNSLRRLLDELEENAYRLTKDWWMSRALTGLEDQWEKRFEELSGGGPTVDPTVISNDRDELMAACEKMKGYVDTHIAHLDATRDAIDMPTIGDAHEAVREIYRIYHRWFQIVTGDSLAPLRPPTWEHVLSVRWIDADTASAISERRRDEWEAEMKELGIVR